MDASEVGYHQVIGLQILQEKIYNRQIITGKEAKDDTGAET